LPFLIRNGGLGHDLRSIPGDLLSPWSASPLAIEAPDDLTVEEDGQEGECEEQQDAPEVHPISPHGRPAGGVVPALLSKLLGTGSYPPAA
jgi:hypothetical protein